MKEMIIRWDDECPDGYIHHVSDEVGYSDLIRYTVRSLEVLANDEDYGKRFREGFIETAKEWEMKDNEKIN